MKRPKLIHFTSIQTQSKFAIRASVHYLNLEELKKQTQEGDKLTAPFESISLLKSYAFRIKLVGLNDRHQAIFKKIYESDSYGEFNIIIPIQDNEHEIKSFQIFEISYEPGLDLLLGTRIPIKLKYPKKIIISDFDKTLVDTRYSTAVEVYESLRRPIDHFPTINASIEILKKHIDDNFQPFILTASPHFYENAIRDWLYQNQVYTAEIFLKDYRKIISLLDGVLTTKDVKSQGFYKLNHLVSIILMTGIPDELVLMGDGFESDPLIYSLLGELLQNTRDPWEVWRQVKNIKAFRLNRKQDSSFLNKVYGLQNEIKRKGIFPKVKIYIRRPEHVEIKPMPLGFLKDTFQSIEYYQA